MESQLNDLQKRRYVLRPIRGGLTAEIVGYSLEIPGIPCDLIITHKHENDRVPISKNGAIEPRNLVLGVKGEIKIPEDVVVEAIG